MKLHLWKLRAGVVIIMAGLGVPVGNRLVAAEVSVGVSISATAEFEAPLAAHGGWVEVGTHGRCWHPNGVGVSWRPYGVGQWTWTDCGWYWETDEPWGWACYHYGSWVQDPGIGWVWVPGVEWAPAWVTWRTGGGYIGWAPMAPIGVVVAPAWFGFVEIGHFHEPIRPERVVVNNTLIINKTTQINDVKRETRNIGGREQRVVVNEGPGVAEVEKATGRKFTPAPVGEVARRTRAPENWKQPERGGDAPRETGARDGRGAQPERGSSPGREERGGTPQPPGGSREGTERERTGTPDRGSQPGREGQKAKPSPPAIPADDTHQEKTAAPERGTPSGRVERGATPSTPARPGEGLQRGRPTEPPRSSPSDREGRGSPQSRPEPASPGPRPAAPSREGGAGERDNGGSKDDGPGKDKERGRG